MPTPSARPAPVPPTKIRVLQALTAAIGLLVTVLWACGGGGGGEITSSAVAGGLQEISQGNTSQKTATIDAGPSAPSALTIPKKQFHCSEGALTCVEVASTSDKPQATVPLTFGLPLKAGAWKHATSALYATDDQGRSIPVQADDISSHRDGTARFAVVSAQIRDLGAGERRVISFFAGGNRGTAQPLPDAPDWNMEVIATIYSPQTVRVTFGNRSGQTAGIPFKEGETIALLLNSQGVTEKFSLTVSTAQAGGGYATLQLIASAFTALINEQSNIFVAEKPLKSYENFFIHTKNPAKGKFSVTFQYSGPAALAASTVTEFATPEKWVYQAQDDLVKAIKSSKASPQTVDTVRFSGPIASEFHLAAPLVNQSTGEAHPFLTARLDARFYEQGKRSRTDVVMENNWAFKPNPRNIRYDLTVKLKGKTLFNQPAFEHFHHARWHKQLWSEEPRYVLRHHMQDFFDSKAVHNYDLSLSISESTLSAEKVNLEEARKNQVALGPMANILIRPDFLSTGGRPDNGPLSRWTVLYLLTQDQRTFESMMANTDASSSIPIHFREEATQHPVNPIEHADVSTHINSKTKPPVSTDPTIWSPDQAHQASYSYVPYLLTGDRFYLEEMMFWASWNVLNQTVANRQGALSLLEKDQIRAQAWALRSFGEAARSLPDKHAMKQVYTTILQNNLDRYFDTYITKKLTSPLGAITHLTGVDTSPWQMDYFMTTMSLLAQNNDPKAQEILNWWGQFSVGRFLADDQGFCAARASGYYWPITDGNGNFLTSLKQIFDLSYPADIGKKCSDLQIIEGYPDYHTGYVAYARGALAAAANAGVPDAKVAYIKWKAMTPLVDAAFSASPNWAIVPRD